MRCVFVIGAALLGLCSIGPTLAQDQQVSLEKFFTPEEIVELTYTVGSYYANGLLTKALRIQPETDSRETVPGKC